MLDFKRKEYATVGDYSASLDKAIAELQSLRRRCDGAEHARP